MGRALALLMCAAALSACSSIPGLPGSQVSVPTISLDSTPPGADVSFSGGGSCKTPCSLAAPGSNGTYYVNFVLNGYTRQSIPVRVSTSKENWYSSETTAVEPSSVMARLEPVAPPPPPPKKKKKRPTTQTAQKPATPRPPLPARARQTHRPRPRRRGPARPPHPRQPAKVVSYIGTGALTTLMAELLGVPRADARGARLGLSLRRSVPP